MFSNLKLYGSDGVTPGKNTSALFSLLTNSTFLKESKSIQQALNIVSFYSRGYTREFCLLSTEKESESITDLLRFHFNPVVVTCVHLAPIGISPHQSPSKPVFT